MNYLQKYDLWWVVAVRYLQTTTSGGLWVRTILGNRSCGGL